MALWDAGHYDQIPATTSVAATDRILICQGTGTEDHKLRVVELGDIGLGAIADATPAEVTGARDETEGAIANLLTVLDTLGVITDSTTAS